MPPPVIQRTINLRVDLRALVALGGALIIIGALLPWVTPLLAPFSRLLQSNATGGWTIAIIGLLAIVVLFLPDFQVPRVNLAAAVFGFVAGVIALSSALNTIGLQQALLGSQSLSPLSGIGLGVYLTLAGSIIAILSGLAPQPDWAPEPAHAEIRLWQPSFAIMASLAVILVVGGLFLGLWLGGGTGSSGTPTPKAFDAGQLGTPLINVQVNPLGTAEPAATDAGQPPAPSSTIEIPTETPLIPLDTPTDIFESPQPTPELERPTPTDTPTPSLTPTITTTPTPSPTQIESSLATPTPSPTPSSTP
jgi:hypothetical protein